MSAELCFHQRFIQNRQAHITSDIFHGNSLQKTRMSSYVYCVCLFWGSFNNQYFHTLFFCRSKITIVQITKQPNPGTKYWQHLKHLQKKTKPFRQAYVILYALLRHFSARNILSRTTSTKAPVFGGLGTCGGLM